MQFKSLASVASIFIGLLPGWAAGDSLNTVELFPTGITSRSGAMEINQAAVDQLRSDAPVVKLAGVPLVNGATAEFTLTEMSVFAPDTIISEIRADGTTASVALPDIRTWYGTDPTNPDRALFASADADGNVKVMVTGDQHTSVTVISPNPGTASYRIDTGNIPAMDFCGTDSISALVPTGEPEPEVAAAEPRADLLYEIELMVDIGNKLDERLQGNSLRLLDYLTDLFGAVNTIYRRDVKANITIKHLSVWKTPEPFSGANTSEQLFQYRDFVNANRRGTNYDLAHYFDYNPSYGGIAWLDVLGSSFPTFRFGVSNIYGDSDFPSDINTYYWDTMVTAHEIGHNVGSPHTHCYFPAIDCCFVESDCSGCTAASPAIGTIMSYCHLQFGNGGDINMVFHERCISLMAPKISGSNRVGIYPNQPNALLEGGAQNVLIPNGSLQTTTLNGTLIEAQMVGGTPTARQFNIRNDGTIPLILTGATRATISGSSLLGISSQPAAGTLAPGESTTFSVLFNPMIAGTYYGTISIPTNDPDTPNYTFGVSARVAQPAPPKTFDWNGTTPIPDADYDGVSVNINATGVPGTIRDVNLQFKGADCSVTTGTGIEHPRVADLAILLESPRGTQCWIMQNPSAATGANFCNTVFDDELANPAISSAPSAASPYTGSFRPYETLNRFAGEDANGTWKLTVIDINSGNEGTLRSASLVIIGNTSSEVGTWSIYE